MLPDGFVFREEFLTEEEESGLIALFRGLSYGSVRMHGVTAKRRVAQFGWHYSFESFRLTPAPPPAELDDPRRRAAALATVDPEEFAEALITEYGPGAGIGWRRDAPPFGIVAGISLGAACRMRFQRGKGAQRVTTAAVLPPRSIYLLTGAARAMGVHDPTRLRDSLVNHVPDAAAENFSTGQRSLTLPLHYVRRNLRTACISQTGGVAQSQSASSSGARRLKRCCWPVTWLLRTPA